MSSIAEAKAKIYNRLANAPTFHPANANLFSDWTIQSGDIIKVSSDGTEYNVPVYGLSMKWNGSTTVNVQSSGEKTRPSLEKMAEKKFSSSSVGGTSYSYRSRKKTTDRVQYIVGIDENGNYFIDHPGSITLAINEANESVAWIDADHLFFTSEQSVQDVCGDWEWEEYQEGTPPVTKKRIVLKNGTGIFKDRDGTAMVLYDDGNLTGEVAIRKINGESVATINAQRIKIGTYGGSNITLNDTFTINAQGEVYSPKAMRVNGIFNCVDHLYLSKGSTGALLTTDIKNAVYNIRIVPNGNTYTLQKQLCDPNDAAWKDVDSFSRATSLSGGWDSGIFTVTATPQGDTFSTNIVQGTPSWNDKTVTIPIEAIDSDNPNIQYATGRSVTATYSGSSGGNVTVGGLTYSDGTRPYSGYDYADTLSSYVQAGHKYVYFRVFLDGIAKLSYYIET